MWRRWKKASSLFIVIYWIVKIAAVSSQNFKISPKPCTVNGIDGTCMFVWECIKSEGQHVGVCVDSFMFGSCCTHNVTENLIPQHHHPTVTYRPKPQSGSKHKPLNRPGPYTSSSGITTIYRPNSGTLVIRPSNTVHHQHQHPPSNSFQRPSSTTSKPIENSVYAKPTTQTQLQQMASSVSAGKLSTS